MGLTKNMISLLLSSKRKHELDLGDLLMIGRQNLHLNEEALQEALQHFNLSSFKSSNKLYNAYAEEVLKHLGANKTHSLDASNYENATLIHDMNTPIATNLENSYDTVLDSGTLEHVFNFPVAISNCMKLTKTGGHFIGIYPCNNFFGHGFYQFSSELFYRTLNQDNGFLIKDVVIFVDEANTKFYNVPDTSEEYHRINFTNAKPVLIYVIAQKLKDVPKLFETSPLQMDYVSLKWKGNKPVKQARGKSSPIIGTPPYVKRLVKAILNIKPPNDEVRLKKKFFNQYEL